MNEPDPGRLGYAPQQLSLELRAALFIAMRSEFIGPSVFEGIDTSTVADLEALLFLGLVAETGPMASEYRLTEAGWDWVIGTGRRRGAGLEGANLEEQWIWTTLGDVLEHLGAGSGRGEEAGRSGPASDRWRRGVCASRARAARRARRRPPEGGCARA